MNPARRPRIFMSTGEASGEMMAVELARAMAAERPELLFAGIGGERMRAAGFGIGADTRGWASMGPLGAVAKVPPLLGVMLRHAFWLARAPADLLVLIDFGAFNLRFAQTLRALGYTRPILYFFPPGAWLDRPKVARAVAQTAVPLTAFAHQRDFYASLGLDIAYFGHPLASLIQTRPARATPPADGGTIALLPGSRAGEIARHMPRLTGAILELRKHRPRLEIVAGAAHSDAERAIVAALDAAGLDARIVRGAREALANADAAFIASGTAVLEAALLGVPAVALYVIERAQYRHARRVWPHRLITLPNILLGEMAVPELLQDDATPRALGRAMDAILADPQAQRTALAPLHGLLGERDALQRCARYALELLDAP